MLNSLEFICVAHVAAIVIDGLWWLVGIIISEDEELESFLGDRLTLFAVGIGLILMKRDHDPEVHEQNKDMILLLVVYFDFVAWMLDVVDADLLEE